MSRLRSGGFTLLEILAVIFIIGIVLTFATLSLGSRTLDDRLEAESKRFEQLLRLAEDEADLKGVPIGLRISESGYRFLIIDSKQNWADYAQSGVFRSRALSQPFFAELRIEGRLIPPAVDAPPSTSTKNGDDSEAKKLQPQVLMLPGGQMTAFGLDLRAANYRPYFHLEGDALGRIKRERREDNR